MNLFKILAFKVKGDNHFLNLFSCKNEGEMKSFVDNLGECSLIERLLRAHKENGFITEENQLEKALNDALQDDSFFIEVTNVETATQLLNIKSKINITPLTAMERSIYLHIIDIVCEDKFGTWNLERAIEKEMATILNKRRIGFVIDNNVVAEGIEVTLETPQVSTSITDETQLISGKTILEDAVASVIIGSISDGVDVKDVCLSRPVAILDEAGKKSGYYKQIVSKVNSINDNKRVYPKEIYQPALNEIKNQGFPYPGEHPHPQSYTGRDNQVHFKTSIPNSAVKFRDAYIDEGCNVWAEYKTLDTDMGKQVQSLIDAGLPIGFSNRMVGNTSKQNVNGTIVEIASQIKLYAWDVITNPAEQEAFSRPIPITDEIKKILLDNKEDLNMNFFKMSLKELKEWKVANAGNSEMAICDNVIALKERADMATTLTDELQVIKDKVELDKKAQLAQQVLTDEINKLPYEQKVKDAIKERGKSIISADQVVSFIDGEKALVDAVTVHTRLTTLGIPNDNNSSRAVITEIREHNPGMVLVDNIMAEMDRELMKKDANFKIDNELRKSNRVLLDGVMAQLERENAPVYKNFMKALKDEVTQIEMTDGVASAPAISTTGEFAQVASVSLAILRQTWQDLKFLQLCLTEGFEGSTYKMPVEFQSSDLYSEDEFGVGELEGIPTESVQTFMLEFGAEWLKRGFVITKEAEEALKTGPFKYNLIAANAANIAGRFVRNIDKRISTEMISRADEYQAIQKQNETPAPTEIELIAPGVNAPTSTNAKFKVKLLCGRTSPLSSYAIPPIVRPRIAQWLDTNGRLQKSMINEIIVKKYNGDTLKQGIWNTTRGQIVPLPGGTTADYAVDFENAAIYFAEGTMTETDKPTIRQYSYATNIAFFDLTVPAKLKGFEARYYNKLLELVDVQQAYMGSSPRYVTPDFLLGSLQAMVPYKQAELFWKNASPDGTSLLGGEMYFGRRNGVELASHNAPWVAGDSRLLLGKRNATRVGMGSSYSLEGPFPHLDSKTGQYTSAKVWNATQQIAVNTPLVIDANGNQYHPPFRTIKYYNS